MADATDTQDQQENQEGQGQEGTEFPFFQKVGEALSDLGGNLAEAFQGQINDAVHDVTDPVEKLKTLAKVLNELVEQYESDQDTGSDGEGESGADEDTGDSSGEDTSESQDSAA